MSPTSSKTVALQYYALLREQRGLSNEKRETVADTPRALYGELKSEFAFALTTDDLKVAVNGEFADFDCELKDGDEVVFIPPVAGG